MMSGYYCAAIPKNYELRPISCPRLLFAILAGTRHILLLRIMATRIACTWLVRLRLKRDGTRTETRFRLLTKGTSPFKSAGASVPSTTGSRVVRISVSNARYTMFRVSVKGTGYPLHSPVSPSLPLPCFTVRPHISTGLYLSSLLLLTHCPPCHVFSKFDILI